MVWRRVLAVIVLATCVSMADGRAVHGQERALENLQFFPEDLPRDSLIQVMRGFSFALGVRCQYCHVGGDGVSFEGVDFASDEDPDKRKARFMLRMVETLNHGMLPLMADRDEPAIELGCKSCHRGSPRPALLTDVMRATLDEFGADSTAAQYSALREQTALSGMYDFGEWEMNVLAERLAREGRPEDAITIYEINLEQYPRSISIVLGLAGLFEVIERPDRAVELYERALEIRPDHPQATARLEALRGAP